MIVLMMIYMECRASQYSYRYRSHGQKIQYISKNMLENEVTNLKVLVDYAEVETINKPKTL